MLWSVEKQLGIFTLHHVYIWILPFPSLLGELCRAEKQFETAKMHLRVGMGSEELWLFMFQGRKNSTRGKVVDKKWFIRIGCLWGLQAIGQEGATLRTFYNFITKGKLGKGGRPPSSSFWTCVKFPWPLSPPHQAGGVFVSCRGQAKTVTVLFKVTEGW